MPDTITLHLMGPDDLERLLAVEEGLFDHAIRPDQAGAYLNDPSHFLVLAYDGDQAVGMASGQILLHPDKAPAFFVAEVGLREAWLRQGIATQMCARLMQEAREAGCEGIWVATEGDNIAARALYRSLDARETADIVVYDWDGAMDG
ncbi:GNAT family N-acetyltransferase [Yoonia litorea]|uniref:Ribosomal protein S18 acetylase RimI n=1 Tax=Yoonia litorea TaxID=1123755 RepID=A0A1I6LE12_9RHOB|nr:GNAT family N-acetyltransferase [Yoonia litorea]SFS01689.1 Ribosomal protein S18 acetylase RimI [Yoonia litorea]